MLRSRAEKSKVIRHVLSPARDIPLLHEPTCPFRSPTLQPPASPISMEGLSACHTLCPCTKHAALEDVLRHQERAYILTSNRAADPPSSVSQHACDQVASLHMVKNDRLYPTHVQSCQSGDALLLCAGPWLFACGHVLTDEILINSPIWYRKYLNIERPKAAETNTT